MNSPTRQHCPMTAANDLLGHRVRGRAIACVQNPIRLDSHSEPQPDFALLRYRPDHYKHAPPTPAMCCYWSRSPIPAYVTTARSKAHFARVMAYRNSG